MNYKTILLSILLTLISSLSNANSTSNKLLDLNDLSIAIFAGGCFWCIEASFEKVKGVHEVISGFSGGSLKKPSYKQVSSGSTKHVEAVKVYFDSDMVSYKDLLEYFWRQIDPTDNEGQFVDRGQQYKPVIFFFNQEQKKMAELSLNRLQLAKRYSKPINIEITPFNSFYAAENYHQNYYKKNLIRYNYYRYRSGRDQFLQKVWGKELKYMPKIKKYSKPSEEVLRQKLTPLQYKITQHDATEQPFKNAYWNEKSHGIYVDIVSGEPLFSSLDKFDSGTGWPSFTQAIDKRFIIEKEDKLLFYSRIEVRSQHADSHLGHVFNDGPKPTGLRYCINSAALKFIPVEQMKTLGYEKYLKLFSVID